MSDEIFEGLLDFDQLFFSFGRPELAEKFAATLVKEATALGKADPSEEELQKMMLAAFKVLPHEVLEAFVAVGSEGFPFTREQLGLPPTPQVKPVVFNSATFAFFGALRGLAEDHGEAIPPTPRRRKRS